MKQALPLKVASIVSLRQSQHFPLFAETAAALRL